MIPEANSVEGCARVQAALTGPARLAFVSMLTLADSSPGEIAVCDTAHESLPIDRPRLHWSVPGPARVALTTPLRRAAYTELETGIAPLAQPWGGSDDD